MTYDERACKVGSGLIRCQIRRYGAFMHGEGCLPRISRVALGFGHSRAIARTLPEWSGSHRRKRYHFRPDVVVVKHLLLL